MKRTFLLRDPDYIIDGQPWPAFRVIATNDGAGWFMTVHEVTGVESASGEPNVDEDDPYIDSCFIKWDGCSHFSFNDAVMLHLCEEDGYRAHCMLLRTLYELGFHLRGEQAPQWERFPMAAFTVQETGGAGDAQQATAPL